MAQEELFVGAALQGWKQVVERVDKVFAGFSDEDLQREVAPGRNRVYYLLGHLTAVHDHLLAILRLGERRYAELDTQFIKTPDRKFEGKEPSAAELRKAWSDANERLAAAFATLKPAEWLERHASVSEEDFAKEPHRHRLSVLLSRTSHAASHGGQVNLASSR